MSLSYLASERVVYGYGGGMSSAKAALESDTRTLAFEAGPSNAAQQRSEEIAGTVELPPPDLDLHRKLALAGAPARRLFGFIDEIEYVSEYVTLRLQRPAARFAIFDPDVTTFALGLSPRRVAPGLGLVASVEYVFEHIRVDPNDGSTARSSHAVAACARQRASRHVPTYQRYADCADVV